MSIMRLTLHKSLVMLAGVAELVDARDSKSRFLWKCGFDSHRPHHHSQNIVNFHWLWGGQITIMLVENLNRYAILGLSGFSFYTVKKLIRCNYR